MKLWKIIFMDERMDIVRAKAYTIENGYVTFWERSVEVLGIQSVAGKVATMRMDIIAKIVEAK